MPCSRMCATWMRSSPISPKTRRRRGTLIEASAAKRYWGIPLQGAAAVSVTRQRHDRVLLPRAQACYLVRSSPDGSESCETGDLAGMHLALLSR